MKRTLSMISFCFLIISCNKNDSSDVTYETVFEISPTIVYVGPAPPAPGNSPRDIPAMHVLDRRDNRSFDLTLNQIQGFTFEEGFSYVLTIEVTELASPPIDGHPRTYRLINIISKT